MAVIKCKMCGGDLVLTEGSLIAECEYCGSLQTVPNAGNEKMLALFARANRLRANCEFDKAFGVYETIVADFPEEAEAYWGLVLCKYGIEYVDDPATHKKIATCHRSSFQSVMEDEDFEQTLENADAIARKVYREEAKQIEELRKGIIEVSSKEEPYDIFICYKEAAANGERTLDSVLAQDIYDALTQKGYRVFFSRISLENKLGQEYEPYIFAALNSAKVMLVVGTDYEHFNAVWVRNEWSRYIKRIETDKNKHLIPCFKDIDAYDMPKEFAKLQAQDLGKVGAMQDLLRGIDKLITPTTISDGGAKGAEIAPLLAMGREALEQGEWGVASSKFDLVLTVDPTCVDAYVGKLMAEFKCKERSGLAKAKKSLKRNPQYIQAMEYADESLKKELEDYCKKSVIRQRFRILGAAVAVVALIGAGVFGMETHYQSVISQFYENPSVHAQRTFSQISDLEWYKEADACTKYLLQKEIPGSYPGAETARELRIPEGVTNVGGEAFDGCTALTSIEIPDSVTIIGESAFKGCTGLTNIEIPDGVTSIGKFAFYECKNLTSIEIPNGVTSIDERAFYGCAGFKSVEIPDSVTSIGESAFKGCLLLASVEIPNSVTSISNSTFEGCSSLSSVVVPDSVTNIGDFAFAECYSLNAIEISNSITSIGVSAFMNCNLLTTIELPDNNLNVGANAFAGCNGLTTVKIPASVRGVDGTTFHRCNGLKDVFYGGTEAEWKALIGDENYYLRKAVIHFEYAE